VFIVKKNGGAAFYPLYSFNNPMEAFRSPAKEQNIGYMIPEVVPC
jgi:hypothetical protein